MLSPRIEMISKNEFPTLSKETTTENRAIRLSTDLVGAVETSGRSRVNFRVADKTTTMGDIDTLSSTLRCKSC